MALVDTLNILALLSGIMAISLFIFTCFFEKNKNKSRILLIWAVLFLAGSFAATEYSLWTQGMDMFKLVFGSFPLIAYFAIWFGFVIWLFESRGERKVWIILLILFIALVIGAVNCMDCITF